MRLLFTRVVQQDRQFDLLEQAMTSSRGYTPRETSTRQEASHVRQRVGVRKPPNTFINGENWSDVNVLRRGMKQREGPASRCGAT